MRNVTSRSGIFILGLFQAADDEDGKSFVEVTKLANEFGTGHAGHEVVGDDEADFRGKVVRAELLQGADGVEDRDDEVTGAFEDGLARGRLHGVVVDEQKSGTVVQAVPFKCVFHGSRASPLNVSRGAFLMRGWMQVRGVGWLGRLGGGALMFAFTSRDGDGWLPLLTTGTGVAAVLIALRLIIPWQYRKQYRKLTSLHGPRTMEADEAGLRVTSGDSDGRFVWRVLERFAENDRVFALVQQGGRVFFTVSKGDMTAEEAAALRFLFETYIPQRA